MIVHRSDCKAQMQQELERRYPKCKIEFMEVEKNNGLKRKGVTILAPEVNIAPTIYIDKYLESGYSLKGVCDEISKVYEEYKKTENLEMDITDFQTMRNRICFKLISVERNEEPLKEMPHRLLYDLAIVYYVLLNDKFEEMATITINHQIAQSWGVTEDDLYKCASGNTEKLLTGTLIPMERIVNSMLLTEEETPQNCQIIKKDNCTFLIDDTAELPMYVLSNTDKTFGAALLLYTEVLHFTAKLLNSNFFILPSSIHELLLIPDNGNVERGRLYQMVYEVNSNMVSQEDFLADNVYYYDAEKDSLLSYYYKND